MGYVTLTLPEAALRDGMLIDMGSEQDRSGIPVTLHEEDLREGTFVIVLDSGGQLLPFTWKSDAGDHRASHFGGVQHGGTLEQFTRRCGEASRFALAHGWNPPIRQHLPREEAN